jgi:hypothetical protein
MDAGSAAFPWTSVQPDGTSAQQLPSRPLPPEPLPPPAPVDSTVPWVMKPHAGSARKGKSASDREADTLASYQSAAVSA